MPIERSRSQPSKSLEEFYQEFIDEGCNSPLPEIAKDMIALVKEINNTFQNTTLYGLTSHTRLVVQATSSWDTPWTIIISSNGREEFEFSYLMPENEQPWPDARAVGTAHGVKDAVKYLLIALEKSNGWPSYKEVNRNQL